MSNIVFDSAGLRALLKSASGPVARDLARRAVRVESQAKINATGRPGPNVISNRLRSSITWELGNDEIGLYVDVGSNVEYAEFVEKGTDRSGPFPYLEPALVAAH